MFGRDSDSEYTSEEALVDSEAAASTGEHAAPTGGGAAGGFLGQVEKSVAKPEGSSGSGGGSGGGGGTDAALPTEGKARKGEEEDHEDSPPPQAQGGAQPKKTLPRPVYDGKADALVEMLMEEGEDVDIAKVRELLDAGIDVRYQVRCSCVCTLVLEY